MSSTESQFADADETAQSSQGVRDGKGVPSTPKGRDGKGYIDEPLLHPPHPDHTQSPAEGSESGSSVEEEAEDEEGEVQDINGLIDGEEHFRPFADTEEDDEGLLPPRPSDLNEDYDEDEEQDWEVDDEDWELADGDFTKQYNRIRQQHAAVHPVSQASSSRLDQPAQLSSRPPLPARNVHPPKAPRMTANQSQTASRRLINPSLLSTGGVAANPKSAQDRQNTKDKADRATHEQVLDSRTRLVLSGLVNRGIIGKIEGCVSTGKEANVYHALVSANPPSKPTPFPESLAVKIYRTSILSFKARSAYIVGEHRFRGGYSSSHNPRKMVRLWAEKELRNLRRLEEGGIRAPRVVEGRENVLVMEFLGHDDDASPRLKDADMSNSKLAGMYAELLIIMRRIFHHCKLVHADLSEYNILYHDGHLYIIDVSQSVEHDHPRAFDFLRADIRNVEDYFVKRSGGEVRTLGVQRTWSFVVDETVGGLSKEEEAGQEGEERLSEIVRDWLEKDDQPMDASSKTGPASEGLSRPTASDDAVFMSSYIPRNLGEVYDPERDVDILRSGRGDKLIYAGLTGLDIGDKQAAPNGNQGSTAAVTDHGHEGHDEDEEDASSDEDEADERRPRGFRHEDRDAKKERKKALKEENREKRKHKMPKAEKQKAIKRTSGK